MEHTTLALLALDSAMAVVLPWQLQGLIHKVARQRARAGGTIVAVEHRSASSSVDNHSSGAFRAVVAFEFDGRTHRFCSAYGSSLHRPQRGSPVRVRFDPLEPGNAEVERGQSMMLGEGRADRHHVGRGRARARGAAWRRGARDCASHRHAAPRRC